jgi:hypothetical protein
VLLSRYLANAPADDFNVSSSSAEHDLAMKISPLDKKKNAPDAPPSIKRSLIVVRNALIMTTVQVSSDEAQEKQQ